MHLTPEDIVGDTLLDYETIASLSPTHDTWPWQSIQLYIHSPADLQLVQRFFLLNSFPDLERISLDNSTEDVAYLVLARPLPRLQRLHGERLMFIPRHPLPSLVELDCYTELDCRFNQMGDRRALLRHEDYPFPLLYAASGARSLRFLNAFLVLHPVGAIQGPFIIFPNVQQVSVEEEWQYISPTLAHIALPPTARFAVFAHTNKHEFHLCGKGFWLDILPPNRVATLPMLAATRALRLLVGLYVDEEETGDGIPYTNGAILTGAHDPSGLYDGVCDRNELSGGSWSVTVTNCLEFSSEAIPVTLREIPAIVDCARLLHLEMHTQPYLMDLGGNEWQRILLRYLVNLQFLEVGGLRAIQMVLYAMEDDEEFVLPNLSHLALCHAALPSQYPLDPKDVLDMVREREKGWNKPLPKLTLRLPDQPRGRLAGCTTLIPDTLELVMQVLAGLEGSVPTVEIIRKYCQCCHDDDPDSALPEGEREETLARYRKMRQRQLA